MLPEDNDRRQKSNSWVTTVLTRENVLLAASLIILGSVAWTQAISRLEVVENAVLTQKQQTAIKQAEEMEVAKSIVRLEADVRNIRQDITWIRQRMDK